MRDGRRVERASSGTIGVERSNTLKIQAFSVNPPVAGFSYPYHLHFAMSKQVTRPFLAAPSSSVACGARWPSPRRALRQLWGAVGFTALGGAWTCHPDADTARGECRTDADCGERGRCRAGRCEGDAAVPVRDAAVPTVPPSRAGEPSRADGLGPTVAPREQWSVDLGAVVYARPTLSVTPSS